jgi:hypothetical protein
MMGIEMVVAVGALLLSLVTLLMLKNQAARSSAARLALSREQEKLTEELSERLRKIGERYGSGNPSDDSTLKNLAATVKVLELRVLEHDTLLCSLVTEDEARHLWNVSRDEPTVYQLHPGVEAELRALVRRGLLKKQGDFKIHDLPGEFDLHDRFILTDSGEMLLALRRHLKALDTRPKDSLPPPASFDAPNSSVTRSAPPPFVRPTGS